MVSMIVARVDDHSIVQTLAENSAVPVINALSSLYHPLQALADLLTIQENYPAGIKGLKVAWVGDATNVLYDLAIAAVKMGIHVAAATPDKYPFDEEVLKVVKQSCQNGARIQLTTDPLEAVKNADIIVTDTWYYSHSSPSLSIALPSPTHLFTPFPRSLQDLSSPFPPPPQFSSYPRMYAIRPELTLGSPWAKNQKRHND